MVTEIEVWPCSNQAWLVTLLWFRDVNLPHQAMGETVMINRWDRKKNVFESRAFSLSGTRGWKTKEGPYKAPFQQGEQCQAMMAHAHNPSTREAEAGRSVSLRSVWSIMRVTGQPGLHRETLSQRKHKQANKHMHAYIHRDRKPLHWEDSGLVTF
jgi:hypothetical protein